MPHDVDERSLLYKLPDIKLSIIQKLAKELRSYSIMSSLLKSGGNLTEEFIIRGVYLETLPWLDVKQEGTTVKFEGPYGEFFYFFTGRLNFRITPMASVDGTHGVLSPNGTWRGVVGMLHRGEADMTICPLAITLQRFKDVTYSQPVYTHYLATFAGEQAATGPDVFRYFMAFDIEVWLALMAAMIVMALLSTLVDWILKEDLTSKSFPYKVIAEHFSVYFGTLFLEASYRHHTGNAGRLLNGTWWLTVLVMMNAFQGHFKSVMTFHPEPERIQSMQDLVRRKDVVPLLWKGAAYDDVFRRSDVYEFRQVIQRSLKQNGFLPINDLFTRPNVERVEKGEAVIVNEVTISMEKIAKQCVLGQSALYISRETFYPHNFAFAFNKYIPQKIKDLVGDRALRANEAGLVDLWLQRKLRNWRRCISRTGTETTEEVPLTLSDLGPVFALVLISLAPAAFAYAGEMVYRKRIEANSHRRSRKTKHFPVKN